MIRLITDDRGSHTTEMSATMVLFALVAGSGFIAFGDPLVRFFQNLGASI